MDVYVARQPIFDTQKNVYAYELLFRSSQQNAYSGLDGDQATSQVISSSFLSIGIREIACEKPVFINFTRQLLLNQTALSVPPGILTVEVLEGIDPTPAIIQAVSDLKTAGYTIALDDFLAQDTENPLVAYADIIKVDFIGTTVAERGAIVQRLQRPGLSFLAEKVETHEEFRQAVEQGYEFFQGYFFQKPEVMRGKSVSSNRLSQVRMLSTVNKPDIPVNELAGIIKQDLALTYKLLKFINAPFFGLKRTINSIEFAINLLGNEQIRRWTSLVALNQISEDKPSELFHTSLVRALFCEGLGRSMNGHGLGSDFFLCGLFSVIDAMLDMPMSDVLKDLPIDPLVKDALTGKPGRLKQTLSIVLLYEQGEWTGLNSLIDELAIPPKEVPKLYHDALIQANEMLIEGL